MEKEKMLVTSPLLHAMFFKSGLVQGRKNTILHVVQGQRTLVAMVTEINPLPHNETTDKPKEFTDNKQHGVKVTGLV